MTTKVFQSRVLSSTLPSLQRVPNPLTSKLHRAMSTLSHLEKYQFKGPSHVPSIALQNHHIDTTLWNDISVVDTDIFINSPAKSGTTWTQEIVCQLLYNGDYSEVGTNGVQISIWGTMRVPSREHHAQLLAEQLLNPKVPRRVIKTHEPIESVPFRSECKHLFVGREKVKNH